jgi:HAE1 family hydrophobic/amphiphilic exporter-1
MWLTRFSLREPLVVAVFYTAVVLLGVVAFFASGRNVLPPIALPFVVVTAPYPGASARDIDELVVRPIEEEIAAVPHVDRVSSTSQQDLATIVVRFELGESPFEAETLVRAAVARAQPHLPADQNPPEVQRGDPTSAPVMQLAVSSRIFTPLEVAKLVDDEVVPTLRRVAGVESIRAVGLPQREALVQVDPGRLVAIGATLLDVVNALQTGNERRPGGITLDAGSETNVAVRADASDATQLGDVPLSLPGGTLRVRDVARASAGAADQRLQAFVDGAPAVLLFVSREREADTRSVVERVRTELRRLGERSPALSLREVSSDLPFTEAAINGVMQTLLEGTALTCLVVLLFVGSWRSAAIAALAIPTSLCATLFAMWRLGFTLDTLSLMGLSLTIGILVDDAVVIIENIARKREDGLTPEDAALSGRREIGGVAFAITLIDVAVFLPIALAPGLIGAFMKEFALAVTLATSFSLLVAFS